MNRHITGLIFLFFVTLFTVAPNFDADYCNNLVISILLEDGNNIIR